MSSFFTGCMVASALTCAVLYALFRRAWVRRVQALERDLQAFSEAMYQMAEVQMKTYRKLAGNLSEIEERILDLAIPSEDSNLPLERRRRVVALAGKGTSMDEIVKRVSVPRGEAELIVSLHRCRESAIPSSDAGCRPDRKPGAVSAGSETRPTKNGELKQYAQA